MQEQRGKQPSGPAGVGESVNREMSFELCLEEGIGVCRAKTGEEGRHSTCKGTEALAHIVYLGSSKKSMARVSRNIVIEGAGEIMWD